MRNTKIASEVAKIESKQSKDERDCRMLDKRQRAMKKSGCYDGDQNLRQKLAFVSDNKKRIREYIRLCSITPKKDASRNKNSNPAKRSELYDWLHKNNMPTSSGELKKLLAICGRQSKDTIKRQTSKRRPHARVARREGVVEDARTYKEVYLDAVEDATLRGVNDGLCDETVLDPYVDCLVNVELRKQFAS